MPCSSPPESLSWCGSQIADNPSPTDLPHDPVVDQPHSSQHPGQSLGIGEYSTGPPSFAWRSRQTVRGHLADPDRVEFEGVVFKAGLQTQEPFHWKNLPVEVAADVSGSERHQTPEAVPQDDRVQRQIPRQGRRGGIAGHRAGLPPPDMGQAGGEGSQVARAEPHPEVMNNSCRRIQGVN